MADIAAALRDSSLAIHSPLPPSNHALPPAELTEAPSHPTHHVTIAARRRRSPPPPRRSTPSPPPRRHMAETANSALYAFQEIKLATPAQASDLRVSKSLFRVQF